MPLRARWKAAGSANAWPAREARREISAAGRQPSKWRWQSARGSAARAPAESAFSVFTIGHPAFRIAGHRHYMRRARFLALFLDVLVAVVPADLAALALTGGVWRFLPG